MDRGPRTGVTEAVFASDLDIGQGVGSRLGWALRLGPRVVMNGCRQWRVILFGCDERLAAIQQIPLLAHATFLAQMESKSISSCEM